MRSRLPQRLVIPRASILGASVGKDGNARVLQNDIDMYLIEIMLQCSKTNRNATAMTKRDSVGGMDGQ